MQRWGVDGDHDIGLSLPRVARGVLEQSNVIGKRLEDSVEARLGPRDWVADRRDSKVAEALAAHRDDLGPGGALGFGQRPQSLSEARPMDLPRGLRGAKENP